MFVEKEQENKSVTTSQSGGVGRIYIGFCACLHTSTQWQHKRLLRYLSITSHSKR